MLACWYRTAHPVKQSGTRSPANPISRVVQFFYDADGLLENCINQAPILPSLAGMIGTIHIASHGNNNFDEWKLILPL